MDRVAARHPDRVKVIDISDIVCPDGNCPWHIDGRLVRIDGLHFSVPAALWLEPYVEARLVKAGLQL